MALADTLVPNTPPLRLAEGGKVIRVGNTRVSLDTLIYAYKQGASPRKIVSSYPTLNLADVYEVIAHYLRYTEEVETYLQQREQEADEIRRTIQESADQNGLRERLLARKSLVAKPNWEARRLRLDAPHIRLLSDFVCHLRDERGLGEEIPYFDPLDGGTDAEALFVMEAPGPKAIQTGFVSCDNPDKTAENLKALTSEADILPHQRAIWNTVPWFLGESGRIRAPRKADIEAGLPYLGELIPLLPRLRAIIFLGWAAQKALGRLELPEGARQFWSPHPSPQCLNRDSYRRGQILSVFREVSAHLKT